jgi:hypothetical protein
MPYDDPEPDDPNILVGVSLPADGGAVHEMAAAIAEEFAAMGFDEGRILALFRLPFYAGAHQALLALGEDEITGIVRESVRVWGRFNVVVKDGGVGEEAAGGRLVRIGRPAVAGPSQVTLTKSR